jgi:hypothetical protein
MESQKMYELTLMTSSASLEAVGVYIVMVGTEYRPYLSWTDCNLKVEVDPG